LSRGLAGDVPERDVEARERERGDAEAAEDMQPLLDLGMQPGDIVGIAPPAQWARSCP
jgi:hypothetical protein